LTIKLTRLIAASPQAHSFWLLALSSPQYADENFIGPRLLLIARISFEFQVSRFEQNRTPETGN
jgi:hypothetical protein